MNKINIVIIAVILPIYMACNHSDTTFKNKKIVENDDPWLSKEIEFPPALLQLVGERIFDIDTTSSLFDSRPKVVSIIDATCSKCILTQMNRLDSIFAELLDAGDRVFVLNVPREDSAYFMYHFQPLINIGGHIIWDSNYYFESANEIFSSNPHRRIFLIDYQNRIVQMGNPLMNKEVMKEYQKSIEQLSPRIDFRL